MNGVIVYWSRYGNGRRVVYHLADGLKKRGIPVRVLSPDKVDPKRMPEADFYVFSSPTEGFRVQRNMRRFMKKLERMDKKKYGIINTHRVKKNWLKNMESILSKKNMVKLAALEFRLGKESEKGNGLPTGWEKKIDRFADKTVAGLIQT